MQRQFANVLLHKTVKKVFSCFSLTVFPQTLPQSSFLLMPMKGKLFFLEIKLVSNFQSFHREEHLWFVFTKKRSE